MYLYYVMILRFSAGSINSNIVDTTFFIWSNPNNWWQLLYSSIRQQNTFWAFRSVVWGIAISVDITWITQPDTHLNFDLLWSAVLARQSIIVLLLSEEVPGCSCVSLAKRGCLKAIMSTSTQLLRFPDWRRTWQGQKSQLKTLEGCVWLLCGHKVMADFIICEQPNGYTQKWWKFNKWILNLFAKSWLLRR